MFRLQQAGQRQLDVVDGVVDHLVRPDVDALGLGELARSCRRAHVEPDDDRVGRHRERDVVLRDAAGACSNDVDPDLFLRQLEQRVLERLHGPLYIGLDDQVEIDHLGAPGLAHQVLEGLALGRDELRLARLGFALLRQVPCLALVVDLAEVVAGARHVTPTEDLHGLGRTRDVRGPTVLVLHRADPAIRGACDQCVADLERALLDEHGRDRPAALVEVSLQHGPASPAGGVALQLLQVGHHEDRVEQCVEVEVGLRGDVDELVVAPPLGGDDTALDHLGPDAVGVRVVLVDLVDRDDDRDVRRLGVIERLHRLRHHAVVGGDDQHDDVGHPGTACTHRGERLMPRGVDEGDLAVPFVRLVGTDVLRDAPELARDHIGGADRVEELRLPVVDVAHDGHDRRAGHQCTLLRILVFPLLELELVLDPDDVRRVVELVRDDADRVIGQRRRGGGHLTGHEQDLHDLSG